MGRRSSLDDQNSKHASTFWIKGATVFTQNEKREVLEADLFIENGRIAEIAPVRRSPLKKTGKRRLERKTPVIDASGLVLIPGFVQAHVHLCQTLFRNQADDLELLDWLSKKIWVFEAAHTEETLYTSALLGIYELLSSGTTCILDMGTVRHTDALCEAVRQSGIRASIGKCLMDHPTRNPKNLQEPTKTALAQAQDLLKRWHQSQSDRIRISYAPRFALSCTSELLTQVGLLAQEHQTLIHTHASENQKEIQLVRRLFGCENLEYLHRLGLTSKRLVLAHGIWLSENEKQILKKTQTHVVHCPSSNLKLASGIAPIPELLKRGINVALGADGAACSNSLNAFEEMRLAALIHKPQAGPTAMKAMEVLDLATRNGAQALDWWDQIGSIEVGKQADLVALDLRGPLNTVYERDRLRPEALASSIVYSTHPENVRWTQVAGQTVYENGRVRAIPLEPLMKRVRRAQEKILGNR
ncbi:MAG: 5'-deoxyadenosine deaminase [Bdellovibrionia bacterium]